MPTRSRGSVPILVGELARRGLSPAPGPRTWPPHLGWRDFTGRPKASRRAHGARRAPHTISRVSDGIAGACPPGSHRGGLSPDMRGSVPSTWQCPQRREGWWAGLSPGWADGGRVCPQGEWVCPRHARVCPQYLAVPSKARGMLGGSVPRVSGSVPGSWVGGAPRVAPRPRAELAGLAELPTPFPTYLIGSHGPVPGRPHRHDERGPGWAGLSPG